MPTAVRINQSLPGETGVRQADRDVPENQISGAKNMPNNVPATKSRCLWERQVTRVIDIHSFT